MKTDVPLSDRRRRAALSRCAGLAHTLWLASLVAACGGGGGSAAPAPTPAPPGSTLAITGVATYDFVPAKADNRGLDYSRIAPRPIRGANVELLAAGGAVLATTTTSETGAYSFSLASSQAVTVRVRAELKRSGAGNGDRDFTVRDNTSGEALYVLDSPGFTPVALTTTQNLNAASGWGGSSYTGARSAGPFAILDVVYAAQAKVATAEPAVALPPLKLFWSPNNQPVDGSLAAGDIGTSFFTFSGGARSLYLLGKENTDTDEYDTHIVAHEFGHYLQSALSRDDSPGGVHGIGDRLDMRLAFSEGWGYAWAGMALGEPVSKDASGTGQATGFFIDVSQPAQGTDRGWYSETAVQYLLWTAHQDAGIGFGPIYTALRGLASAPTFTSPYSFVALLKAAAPSSASALTTLWASQQIVAQDALGSGETNAGGDGNNLPVYKAATLGATQNYCVNTTADPDNDRNKLGRYVHIVFTASGSRTLTATRSGGDFAGASDPDLLLLKSDGSKVVANVEITPTQALTTTLPTGTHVVALEDYNLTPPSISCFNFTVN